MIQEKIQQENYGFFFYVTYITVNYTLMIDRLIAPSFLF